MIIAVLVLFAVLIVTTVAAIIQASRRERGAFDAEIDPLQAACDERDRAYRARHRVTAPRMAPAQPAPEPTPDTITFDRLTDTGELRAIAAWGHETRAAYHADTNLFLRGLYDRYRADRKAISP